MNKVALLIVYNHRYDKNIPVLEKIYAGRFSHIFHIVPFYDGSQENVIPVYESSYYFSGYLAQAFVHLKDKGFTHFFIVADDMVIHPGIHQENLWEKTGIGLEECYLPRFVYMQERGLSWDHTMAGMKYKVKQIGAEISNILPPRERAEECFRKFHLPLGEIDWRLLIPRSWKELSFEIRRYPFSRRLDYPLVGGYCDILLLPASEMQPFCAFCGAFSATKLFVEIAIPTAMALCAKSIVTQNEIRLKNGDIWEKDEIEDFAQKYHYSVSELEKNWPEDKFFIHPVKLSKWKL